MSNPNIKEVSIGLDKFCVQVSIDPEIPGEWACKFIEDQFFCHTRAVFRTRLPVEDLARIRWFDNWWEAFKGEVVYPRWPKFLHRFFARPAERRVDIKAVYDGISVPEGQNNLRLFYYVDGPL